MYPSSITLTGTPKTIREEPKTETNVKPLQKPQEEQRRTAKNSVLRIPFGTFRTVCKMMFLIYKTALADSYTAITMKLLTSI